MSKIDYQKLREIAEKTKIAGEAPVMPFDQRINALNDFMKHFSPDIALALLDERERNLQYIKSRDQENEEIALTVGKLRVELEAAKKRIAEPEAEPVSQTYKLHELSGNSPVTPDGWISCSEKMPEIGELNWRTGFPLLVTCEIGVIPAYYGFVSINGDNHYGFMESFKYGDGRGNHPQTNEYGLISNATHWMPLPEPPQEVNRG
nr:ead/Ea22-like family protein [Escherichia coli]